MARVVHGFLIINVNKKEIYVPVFSIKNIWFGKCRKTSSKQNYSRYVLIYILIEIAFFRIYIRCISKTGFPQVLLLIIVKLWLIIR